MANVIDAFVVELGLDPAKFTAGQREAMDALHKMQQESVASAKELEGRTKRTNDLLVNFRREALSVFGLFYGGMGVKDFIGYITNLDAATGRFAKTLGITESELQTWQGAIRATGGTTESASAAIGGLNSALVHFTLTGQRGALGVLNQLGVGLYDQNNQLKTATQLYRDIAEAVERQRIDPRRAAGLLSLLPGMNQDMINLLLKGSGAVEKYLSDSQRAGTANKEASDKAEAFQKELADLTSAATHAGRSLLQYLYTPLGMIAGKLRELIELSPTAAGAIGAIAAVLGGGAAVKGALAGVRSIFGGGAGGAAAATGGGILGSGRRLLGKAIRGVGGKPLGVAGALLDADPTQALETEQPYDPITNPGGKMPAGGGGNRTPPTPGEMEAYIRRSAVARGIDPNTAVAVAKSEGMFAYNYSPTGQSFVPGEQSFGPFQLNYATNGRSLGNQFTRKTGLDARDHRTWERQVDFSLDEAKKGGWGPWHGWKGHPRAGLDVGPSSVAPMADAAGGPGSKTSTTTVSIGNININAPGADVASIARDISAATKREMTAAAANSGAN